jgi:hypothetical protein
MHKAGFKRPSPAMVMAVIALIAALGGTAWAKSELEKNSVGSRQIQAKAVITSKLGEGAVTGAQVASKTLDGSNINANELGTVPTVTNANNAGDAQKVGGHNATCPSGTTLVRGVCFDSSPSGPVSGVQNAAIACANRGGWLPTPQELYSARGVLNLGDGTGTHSEFTDSLSANTSGTEYGTTVVSATEEKFVLNEDPKTKELVANYEYICAYPLVR